MLWLEVIVGFRVNLIFIFLYFKVVHCTGCMKMQVRVSETGEEEQVPMFLVGIGVPLMFSSTFEVPLDRATFTSRHSLDMNFLSCDERLVKKIPANAFFFTAQWNPINLVTNGPQ